MGRGFIARKGRDTPYEANTAPLPQTRGTPTADKERRRRRNKAARKSRKVNR